MKAWIKHANLFIYSVCLSLIISRLVYISLINFILVFGLNFITVTNLPKINRIINVFVLIIKNLHLHS